MYQKHNSCRYTTNAFINILPTGSVATLVLSNKFSKLSSVLAMERLFDELFDLVDLKTYDARGYCKPGWAPADSADKITDLRDFLQPMKRTANNKRKRTDLNIPLSVQQSGENILEIRQIRRLGERWGVRRIKVFQ